MANGNSDAEIWQCLEKIREKLEGVSDITIRTEGKVDNLLHRTSDNETQLAEHNTRIHELERTISEMQGAHRMACIVGGCFLGLLMLAEVMVVAFLK